MSLTLDVRDLIGRPGSSREVGLSELVEDLRTELVEVPADRPVALALLLESVTDGLLISGGVTGRVTMSCARCLATFEQDLQVTVHELFAPEPEEDEDVYPVREGSVDLEPMIRDALVLAMPFAPLCREDCLGLCERCGGDRNRGECTCVEEVDPRWSALAALDLTQLERLDVTEGPGKGA